MSAGENPILPNLACKKPLMRYLQHIFHKAPLTRKHERTLRYLLIGTAAFSVAAYMLTLLPLRMGYQELNPLKDLVDYPSFFLIIKLVLVPLMLYFVWAKRYLVGRRIMLYAWVAFLVYQLSPARTPSGLVPTTIAPNNTHIN